MLGDAISQFRRSSTSSPPPLNAVIPHRCGCSIERLTALVRPRLDDFEKLWRDGPVAAVERTEAQLAALGERILGTARDRVRPCNARARRRTAARLLRDARHLCRRWLNAPPRGRTARGTRRVACSGTRPAPSGGVVVVAGSFFSSSCLSRPGTRWGLLRRDAPSDRERAVTSDIETLLGLQYDRVGTVWHGTLRPLRRMARGPGADAIEWDDYDPNWRQFLGTTFAVILDDIRRVTCSLPRALRAAIDRAVAGEPRDRVRAELLEHRPHEGVARTRRDVRRGRWSIASMPSGRSTSTARPPTTASTCSPSRCGGVTRRRPAFGGVGPSGCGRSCWRDIARWWHPRLAQPVWPIQPRRMGWT